MVRIASRAFCTRSKLEDSAGTFDHLAGHVAPVGGTRMSAVVSPQTRLPWQTEPEHAGEASDSRSLARRG